MLAVRGGHASYGRTLHAPATAVRTGSGTIYAGGMPVRDAPVATHSATLLAAAAALPAVRLLAFLGRRVAADPACRRLAVLGLCPACGYDLTGNVSGVCPECGSGRDAA